MNQVGGGQGFGSTDNEWVVLAADGSVTPVPRQSKDALADFVLDLVTGRLALTPRAPRSGVLPREPS